MQGAFVGRFPVGAVIGSGGFGSVYAGTDPVTGDPVAVKVLDRADPDVRRRLHDEAQALRRVNDPHCVRVRDVVDEPNVAAIVTDLIPGASLRAVMRQQGRLPGVDALRLLRGALKGLVAVHAAGLVHGDLKPDNILIDPHGTARLIDFGLAGAAGRPADADHFVGSPAYVPPEQVRGAPLDARTDIYACAIVLFELLCGRRPYVGATSEQVLDAQLRAPVPDPRMIDPQLGEGLARLCVRGMAKDPAERPASAVAFLAELEDAAARQYGAAWAAAGAGIGVGGVVGALLAAGPGRGVLVGSGTAVAPHVASAAPTSVVASSGARAGRVLGHGARRMRPGVLLASAAVVVIAVIAVVVALTSGGDKPIAGRPPTVPAGGSSAPTSGGSNGAPAVPTRVVTVRPVVSGAPAAGWTVVKEKNKEVLNECTDDAALSARSGNVYQCIDGVDGDDQDTCWVIESKTALLCLENPFSRTLVRHVLDIAPFGAATRDRSIGVVPLGMTLDNGWRCRLDTLAFQEPVTGQQLDPNYFCSDDHGVWRGPGRAVAIDKTSSAWAVYTATRSGAPLTRHTITEAIFVAA